MSRAAAMLEARLEAHLHNRVRAGLGGMLIKLMPVQRGVPDRLVLLPGGRMFLVELKTDTGRLSELQKHWHERAADVGTHVVVLRGRDEVDAWVRLVAEQGIPPHLRSRKSPTRKPGPACDGTCTTDCGRCKGAGQPKSTETLEPIADLVQATTNPQGSTS